MSSFTKFFMVATATLMSTAQANACWFTGCMGGAPRTTFYAPVAPAPCAAPVASCNPCNTCAAPTTVGYAPYTVGYAPYTAYRPTLFGGYRPYTAGYAPYTAAYAPAAYTSYSAGYAPLSYSSVAQTSYYAPTTVLSPSCGCASPCSSCATGTCNSCNTVPSTTFAPSSVTPTTYIQSTTPTSGCSTCGVNQVSSTTSANDNRYFTTPTTTSATNTTFANTNAGTQFVTGSSEMRAVKSTNAQTPIAEETNRSEAPRSSVVSPLTPGRQFDPENKTTLKPIVNLNERFVEVPRILPIVHSTAKPLSQATAPAGDDWGR